jgi:hypothetical protein
MSASSTAFRTTAGNPAPLDLVNIHEQLEALVEPLA